MRTHLDALQPLFERPGAFDFFAALRLIEEAYPDKPRIGESSRLRDDSVRISQVPSLAFEPSAVLSVERAADDVLKLETSFFGLLGPGGPLPLHLTEYARDRLRHADDAGFARFLDLFNNRLAALFYRAWASAQPAISLQRPDRDRFSRYVGSLIGIGMDSLRNRDAVPDLAKLHHAGRLAVHKRNAESLAAILVDDFGVPVKVQEFIGEWMPLPDDGQCRLVETVGGRSVRLGENTVLGRRVWGCQHKFRIAVGPLELDDLNRFLPGGERLGRLAAWVRNYAGLALSWDVNLIVKKDALPPLRLGRQSRLGWRSWLSSHPPATDDAQLILAPVEPAGFGNF